MIDMVNSRGDSQYMIGSHLEAAIAARGAGTTSFHNATAQRNCILVRVSDDEADAACRWDDDGGNQWLRFSRESEAEGA